MSADSVGLAALCVTILSILVGFVWKSAVTATSHEIRIGTLESEHRGTTTELRSQIKELEGVINDLRQAVWNLTTRLKVNAARASQGQFDEGSERPPRG